MSKEQTLAQPEEQPEDLKTYPLGQKMGYGAGALLAAGAVDLFAHLGPTGMVVGAIAAYVAAQHGPELMEQVRGALPSSGPESEPENEQGGSRPGRSFWDRALGRFPEGYEAGDRQEGEQGKQQGPSSDDDALFAQPALPNSGPGVKRLTIDQIVRHTEYNSYTIYIGRSMTKPGNPAVRINLHKKHIKLIGASQKGKSSMAGALLDIITRTHDTQHALISLLDLENKTSQLFANSEHIANIRLSNGQTMHMHAHNPEEVLERLIVLVQLMEYRYTLNEIEVEQQPIIFTYVEEFIDLKNYFRNRAANAKEAERKQAEADYSMLVYCIDKLARRGLKARIQFLLCAQVDYRDKDIQEALVNISNGISFSVRVTAAQAAGFMNIPLLRRNALEDYDGQAVVEMPELKDLVLAPDYDLRARLKELAKKEMGRSARRSQPQANHAEPPLPEDRQKPAAASLQAPVYGDEHRSQAAHSLRNPMFYEPEEELPSWKDAYITEEPEEFTELTEREYQYQQVLDVWNKDIPPHGRIDSIRTLALALEMKFNEARELLEEMDEKQLINWRNREKKAPV